MDQFLEVVVVRLYRDKTSRFSVLPLDIVKYCIEPMLLDIHLREVGRRYDELNGRMVFQTSSESQFPDLCFYMKHRPVRHVELFGCIIEQYYQSQAGLPEVQWLIKTALITCLDQLAMDIISLLLHDLMYVDVVLFVELIEMPLPLPLPSMLYEGLFYQAFAAANTTCCKVLMAAIAREYGDDLYYLDTSTDFLFKFLLAMCATSTVYERFIDWVANETKIFEYIGANYEREDVRRRVRSILVTTGAQVRTTNVVYLVGLGKLPITVNDLY